MKDECYQFLKNEIGKVDIVGFGSYGEVKLARNTQNNSIVAIKMIYNKNAKQQIDVHHKLIHPNIIKLINYYYQKEKNVTYMVLEYASGGSLNEKIKFGYGQLNKQLVKRYFKGICEAVKYLHQNNFMHRDIKPQNILITKDNQAKLCDFGFASILEYRSTLCGTFQYMAPEMIQKKPYDFKIDIWALGILLFELIQGYAPFRGETGEEVITEMKKPLIFSNRFDSIEIELIKKILRVNAENRPEIAKILEHAYFKQNQEDVKFREELQAKAKEERSAKEVKNLKDLREEEFVAKQAKEVKVDPIAQPKKNERKFDFLQRKGQMKKQQKKPQKKDEILPVQKVERKQFPKQPVRQQVKKQQIKRQFKPFVPINIQNSRSGIKSPLMKQIPPTGFIPIPVSPNGYQQNPHQFNSSMQVPPTHNTQTALNSSSYQPTNIYSSITSLPGNAKYFLPSNPNPIPSITQSYQPSFTKPVVPAFFIQQRSPSNQSFNNSLQQPLQTNNPNYLWKKT